MSLLLSNCTSPTPCASLTHAELLALLQRSGLRLTQSRSLMLATLLRCSTPVTLAQLQAAIQPKHVALATLFRSMLRFEEAELVTRTIDHHGTTNWELSVGRGRTFHLTDRQSGEIAPLDADIVKPLHDLLARIEQTLAQGGYRHLQLNVAFHGCRPKSATERQVA